MSKWDKYFHSHYNPVGVDWGTEDVKKYKSWYYSWIEYIFSLPLLKKSIKKNVTGFEIGSGIGGTTSLLAEKEIQMTGSDISKEIVKDAGKVIQAIRFIYCDIQKGILTKKKYNFIFGFEVLEHIPYVDTAIKNIRKSLKNGGYFIGSSPFPYKKAYLDPTHCNVLYPKDWIKLFKDEKFSKVITYPMSFFPLLWRLDRRLNIVIPFYISLPGFVSTTLIIAKK